MNRFILYLVRKKFGLDKYEGFQFTNQKSNEIYYFTDDKLMKFSLGMTIPSTVSFNWLFDKDCKVVGDKGYFRWI